MYRQAQLLPLEREAYLADGLLTYIGNKRALLPFIFKGLNYVKRRLNTEYLDCLDLFSGSGSVSRLMKAHARSLVSNDFEAYTAVVNRCYLSNRSAFPAAAYREARALLLEKIKTDWRRGFIAENYAPLDDAAILPGERVFFTRRNAEYIDTARQHIESITGELQHFFLGPLLVRASVHNNTAGVFKGFYKNRQGIGAFGGEAGQALKRIKGEISIPEPLFSDSECPVTVTKFDATRFADDFGGAYDLVYMDPPYNQHPYGSNYFMLNLILRYVRPAKISRVSGIPVDWQRSPFNKPRQASAAFFKIIDALAAKFFLISYNSEGFLQKDEFFAELKRRGRLKFFATDYNAYRGARNLSARPRYVEEYLFVLEKA